MANVVQWLMPKEQKFFNMLKDQSSNVLIAAQEFKKLIFDYNGLTDARKKEIIERINEMEHKGDEITHGITGILDKTFITPIDKEDIHQLAMLLDDVMDYINTTAKRFAIFKINKIDSHIKKFAEIILEIVKKIDEGILEMSKLRNMNQFYIDVHTLENKGDDIFHAALAQLFDNKEVIDVIKYKEIYEFLENIIDKCEVIANVIESIVVKHA
jgi:hypothetical protein|tara:strand:+ start:717 stop:1355 length:639 start_codon:yes stop_codon:yes gene_type:complete